VQRRGELVTLAPTIEVDAITFEKLAAGSAADRRLALDMYRADVADVQLAYDEVAMPLRRRLATVWRDLAREALADPVPARGAVLRIAAVASRGAATDPELAAILASAERHLDRT